MPNVDTIPLETLAQSPLRSLIDRARELKVPDPLFFQVLGHVPGYTEATFDALYRSHAEGNVDHKLKEIIRIRLARLAEDNYFSNLRSEEAIKAGFTEELIEAGCGNFEKDKRLSAAEKWALSYAHLMYTEPKKVNKDFNARFDAKERTYLYKILDRRSPPAIQNKKIWHVRKKLDEKLMKKASKTLEGKHDFTSFRSTDCQAKSPIKTINSIKIIRKSSEIEIWIKAKSFLHNQVRIIAGTLMMVGKAKCKKKDIERALKAKKRGAAGQTAPAWGLFLYSVKY